MRKEKQVLERKYGGGRDKIIMVLVGKLRTDKWTDRLTGKQKIGNDRVLYLLAFGTAVDICTVDNLNGCFKCFIST